MVKQNYRAAARKVLKTPRIKSVVTTFIFIISIVAIVIIDSIQRHNHSPLTAFAKERTLGSPAAPLKVLEFIDFECPECARGELLLQNFLDKHPQEIQVGAKYFPLSYPHSIAAAVYAECAARQNKFWEFAPQLFKNQIQWAQLEDPAPYFKMLARRINLNIEEMESCTIRSDVRATIGSDKTLGESYYVRSTPTYFVNKQMVVGADELQKFLTKYFKDK